MTRILYNKNGTLDTFKNDDEPDEEEKRQSGSEDGDFIPAVISG